MKTKLRYLSTRTLLFFAALVLLLVAAICLLALGGLHGNLLPFFAAGLALLTALLLWCGRQWIYLPYQETRKLLLLFAGGYAVQDIFSPLYPFTPESEAMLKKMQTMLNTSELISATKKQAQYLALQNQINPHFLYNTLEGIRGEAMMAGLDTIAEMTEALATFFRYTISNVEQLVTLEDELENVESYYVIQQYRFGERLRLAVEFDEEEDKDLLLHCRLPKLTLQPIVENAIFHGIERKVSNGLVRVRVQGTQKRLIVTVSDDGQGMEPERLHEMNEKLNHPAFEYVKPDSEKKGGIAIVNVNNRIKLLFGESYGINLYSTPGIGTDVEVNLPLLEQGDAT